MMRPLTRLWRSLEAIPGLIAAPALWEAYCGPDFDVIRPHLRPTETMGSIYPCPRMGTGHCSRRIVDYGDGGIAAICRDPHQVCDTVKLTALDALLHEVDLRSFIRTLGRPIGLR